jgi:uncharacterized protein GlcG (DUF336 family)
VASGRALCYRRGIERKQGDIAMSNVTLEQASTIIDTALATAHEKGFAALTVVVLDAGGCPVALKREDGSALLRHRIATAKAWGVLGMGEPGRKLRDRAQNNPAFFNVLVELADGNIIPNPGGVIIRDKAGAIVGSVGISGDTGDNDEICAVAGIKAAGLVADDGQ